MVQEQNQPHAISAVVDKLYSGELIGYQVDISQCIASSKMLRAGHSIASSSVLRVGHNIWTY